MDDLNLAGLYVPLVTPFTAGGELAPQSLERLAHTVIDEGAAGVVALGTTGEPATLTAQERHTVLDVCARVCRERSATLIAGAGSNDTRASAGALAELKAWPEISAALTVVPYYTRPSQDGVIAHFTVLTKESPVPLIVYNIPYRTGQAMGWRALRQLAGLPGIAGIKHAAGGIDADTVRLMADLSDRFAVLGGDDIFDAPLLALGATGAISCGQRVHHGLRRHGAGVARRPGSRGPGAGEPAGRALRGAVRRAEPRGHQGRAARAGPHPEPAVRLPLLPASPAAAREARTAADAAAA